MPFLCKQPKAQLALCGQAAEVGSPGFPPHPHWFILFYVFRDAAKVKRISPVPGFPCAVVHSTGRSGYIQRWGLFLDQTEIELLSGDGGRGGMANCKTNQAMKQAFWQDSKRAEVHTHLAFMHTHKNAHTPTHIGIHAHSQE